MRAFHAKSAGFETRAPGDRRAASLIWFVPALVILGAVAAVPVLGLAQSHGGVLALMALLALPVAIVLLAMVWHRIVSPLRRFASRFTIWHLLWFLIFASALVFRQRDVNQIDTNPLDAWALYRVSLEFIVGSALLIRLAVRRPDWLGSMFRGYIGVLTIFALVCAASTAWSVFPAWTLYKSCEYLLDLALLAAILDTVKSTEGFKFLFNWTWFLYGLIPLCAWLGALVWPQAALHPHGLDIGMLGVRLMGLVPRQSSDGIGLYAAMVGVVAFARLFPMEGPRRKTAWYLLLLLACVITMVFSQTRMAIGGFLIAAGLILFFSRRLRLGVILAFLSVPLLLLTGAGNLIWTFLKRGQSNYSLTTLSSRTVWWSFAWHQFLQRPLTGFGAYTGRFVVLARIGMTMTASLHSDFLGIIVGTGIWGMIPFVAVLVGLWWFFIRYLRHTSDREPGRRQLACEAIAVFAVLTVNSFLLPMLTWQAPLYFLVILGYAEFLRRRQLQYLPVAAIRPPDFDSVLATPHTIATVEHGNS